MARLFDVAVKVIAVDKRCSDGMEVGKEWVIGRHTPDGLCLSAYHSIYPYFRVLRCGGSFPWSDDPDKCTACCPDPGHRVVFELKRIHKQ